MDETPFPPPGTYREALIRGFVVGLLFVGLGLALTELMPDEEDRGS